MVDINKIVGCPVCTRVLAFKPNGTDPYSFSCYSCGEYELSSDAIEDLPSFLKTKDSSDIALFSHYIRKRAAHSTNPLITLNQLIEVYKADKLPSPAEQLDNLILWLGEQIDTPNGKIRPGLEAAAEIGAIDTQGLAYIVNYAIKENYITGAVSGQDSDAPTIQPVQITLSGWKYLENLKRGSNETKLVFMAMPFGDLLIEGNYINHWKPLLAKQLGLNLKKLNENQPAGLIDARMRVEIRQAKFLIAELTNENRGAYWEAGYAEGLGKPVIYLCEDGYFHSHKSHFDTNHHTTITWASKDMQNAEERLLSTIKATFPGEF